MVSPEPRCPRNPMYRVPEPLPDYCRELCMVSPEPAIKPRTLILSNAGRAKCGRFAANVRIGRTVVIVGKACTQAFPRTSMSVRGSSDLSVAN